MTTEVRAKISKVLTFCPHIPTIGKSQLGDEVQQHSSTVEHVSILHISILGSFFSIVSKTIF